MNRNPGKSVFARNNFENIATFQMFACSAFGGVVSFEDIAVDSGT